MQHRSELKRSFTSGFTLIELLIVVAIIAILAAIAVPNFLQAQVRAKVSRVYADMRSEGVAIMSYAVDHGKEPPGATEYEPSLPPSETWILLQQLTSPVAYITSLPEDPFYRGVGPEGPYPANISRHFYWTVRDWDEAWPGTRRHVFRFSLRSYGPDRVSVVGDWWRDYKPGRMYDATNGTKSYGDIVCWDGYLFTYPSLSDSPIGPLASW